MAFENVFGNINWALPVQQANADRQYFADMLGRGIQQAQFKKQMDLRERQLAAEREAEMSDPKSIAQRAVMAELQKQGMSPDQAAMTMMYGAEQGMRNPYTGELMGSMPSKLQQWGINPRGSQAQSQYENVMDQSRMGTPYNPDTTQAPQMLPIGGGEYIDDLGIQNLTPAQVEAAISNRQLYTDEQGNEIAYDRTMGDVLQAATEGYDIKQLPRYGMDAMGAKAKTTDAIIDLNKEAASQGLDLKRYIAEKEIDSIFKGEELIRAAQNEQKAYSQELGRLVDGYEKLWEAGGAIETLGDNYTISDVIGNITNAAKAGPLEGVSRAMGAQSTAAIDEINSVRPIMFGKLRTLLGMTGKELDTKPERDFYMGALSRPDTSIDTILNVVGALDKRYGTGEYQDRINAMKDKIQTKRQYNTPEKKMQRLMELREKANAQ